jgi:bifunctional DNase/RNase
MIDARPSDSIALAVRVEAPIFVEEEVFETLQKYEGQIF